MRLARRREAAEGRIAQLSEKQNAAATRQYGIAASA
jgi:hypothetical protein